MLRVHEIKKFSKFDVALETGGCLDLLEMKIIELRKKFDPALALDLKALHGIDLEDEIMKRAMLEIKMEQT